MDKHAGYAPPLVLQCEAALVACGLRPDIRAERLTLEQFVKVFLQLLQQQEAAEQQQGEQQQEQPRQAVAEGTDAKEAAGLKGKECSVH